MHPHAIRNLETILSVILMCDQDLAISCHSMPFLQSWTWLTLRLVTFYHGLSQVIKCAVLWLAPTKMGWSTFDRAAECAIPSSLEVDFVNSNFESRTSPIPIQGSIDTPTNSPCEWKELLGERNIWGTRTSRGEYLRNENFQGDCSQFFWLTPHWG